MKASAVLALLLVPGAGLGCSISQSSQSFSDSSTSSSGSVSDSSNSISDSSRSSSGSSSPEEQQAALYEADVADYTEAHLISGGADAVFLRGVGDIARERGVSDWEADRYTWEGIGRGLARLELNPLQLEVLMSSWSGGDRGRMQGIQRGYDAAR